MKSISSLLYEQPFNEQIRLCLRLENLFSQIKLFLQGESPWQSRASLDAIIEIVNIIDRPDMKSVLTKELMRHHATFLRLHNAPHINQNKLQQVLTDIENIVTALNAINGKLAHSLRDNDFINSIRMYRANPGGVSAFDVPALYYWLHQPHKARVEQLSFWLSELSTVNDAALLILQLVRQSNVAENKTAINGLFQTALDPKIPCQLVRVMLSKENNVYPEISVGRHRVYIRFLLATMQNKPLQTTENIDFQLTCCVL